MSIVAVGTIFAAIMCAVALRANVRLRDQRRLPMQWWITGEVTWWAPRPIALAFIPVLAIVLLGFVAVMALTVPPRPGQEGLVLPTAIGMGVMLVAVQRLHLWLADRTLRRKRP